MGRIVSTNELIQQVYRKATGELDDSVSYTDEDGKTVLSVINEQIDTYYNMSDRFGEHVVWCRNIDDEYSLGTADGTETVFDIDWTEVQSLPSGFYMPIRVREADGKEQRYDLVPFNQLYDSRNSSPYRCSLSANGLVFFEAPVAGEVLYPCIPVGNLLLGPEEDVEAACGVKNLTWLAFAAAAEYVRTDIVRGDQYPNILAQANDIMNAMLSDNEARTAPLMWESPTQNEYDW